MNLVLVGLNHHTASVDVREKCALTENGRIALTYRLIASPLIHAVVILTTCNRLEIYADCADVHLGGGVVADTLQHNFDLPENALYQHHGADVVSHLLRVACGLDSMVLGEAQILGQVADAYQSAQQAHTLTPNLHRLFMTATQTGKRAHSETAISRYATSVSHIALNLLDGAQSVLIIGAGEMAEQAVYASHDKYIPQIHIINRTYEAACILAGQIGGEAHLWSNLWDMLATVDAVITATRAPHPILRKHDLAQVINRRQHSLTIVDIALPRDVEHAARTLAGLTVYDIDDIQQVVDENVRQRRACIPAIEQIIRHEAEIFLMWARGRGVVPTITDLRQKVQAIAQHELEGMMNRLNHLSDADLQLIQKLMHRVVNKILHEPTLTLRQHAQTGDADDYSRVVRELFTLDERKVS